jgi:hypothetical protein
MSLPLPFKVTKRLRDKVMRLVGAGMAERNIADAIGCARKTLRNHFAHELEVGRARVEAELNDLLWEAARDNKSVAAIKHLQERASGERVPYHMTGKKDQQIEAAKTAGLGTEWEADIVPANEIN